VDPPVITAIFLRKFLRHNQLLVWAARVDGLSVRPRSASSSSLHAYLQFSVLGLWAEKKANACSLTFQSVVKWYSTSAR
jgi:hypothetical protein